MFNKLKQNLNKYVIGFLILSITLFGGLSFIIDKNLIDSYINYYIIISSGLSIVILFLNNIEKFKFKNLKKIPCIFTLLFFIWLLISAFFGIGIYSETIKGFINFGCLLALGLALIHLEFTEKDKKFIKNCFYLSFFICMILGIYQYFSGINLISYSNYLYPGIKGRINSTFYIATILDKYIVLITVMLLYSLINEPKKKSYKILLLLSGIGISLTFSRSGQLIFLFVLGILFLISLLKKQISNVLIVLITIGGMLLIPGTSLSIQSGLDFVYNTLHIPNNIRLNISSLNNYLLDVYKLNDTESNNYLNSDTGINEEKPAEKPSNEENNVIVNQSMDYREKYKNIGKQLIDDYPIFGIGIGNYNYLYNNQNFEDYMSDDLALKEVDTYMYPHNTFIHTIAEVGVIGFILLILTILSYMTDNIKNKKWSNVLLSLLLILVLLLSGYIEGVFHSKQYIFVFIIFFSFICSKTKNIESKDDYSRYLKRIYGKSKEEYYKFLKNNLKTETKKFIITVNPESLVNATKDEELNRMLLDKNVSLVPDGIAVVKACKILDIPVTERIAGVDIAEYLLKEANDQNKSIYLLGAKKEVIKALVEKIKINYPNINILGYKDGYIKDKDKIFKEIIKLKPDICLVALGIPHQEKLIYKHLDKFDKGIFVGVGGTFDVLSGTKKRAPKIFIKLNLEWLYRIMCEPKRLKRFYDNNVKFILKIKNK